MSHKRKRKNAITFTTEESLAMYRTAFYSAMGIRNGDPFPTDSQCVAWFTRLRLHAERLQVGPHLPAEGFLPKEWLEEVGYGNAR